MNECWVTAHHICIALSIHQALVHAWFRPFSQQPSAAGAEDVLLPFCWEGPEIGLLNNSPMSADPPCPCFPAQEQSSPWGQGHRVKVAVTWDNRLGGSFLSRPKSLTLWLLEIQGEKEGLMM